MEDEKSREQRYQYALSQRQLYSAEFDQAYRWMMPNRLPLTDDNNGQFVTSLSMTRGQNRTWQIFDPTGIESVYAFANNIQMTLMPPYTKWGLVDVADNVLKLPEAYEVMYGPITEQTKTSIKKQLEDFNAILYVQFQKSKLEAIINECFQDLAISMGVLFLHEGTLDDPVIYDAIPANQVVIEVGANGEVCAIWYPITLPARMITQRWPDATLPEQLKTLIQNNPNQPVKLIMGTVHYYDNPPDEQIYFYVKHNDTNVEIIHEFKDMFPWIVFRGAKSPGEEYGRGPALTAVSFVRELNKITEYMLKGLQTQAYPVLLMSGQMDRNPYTFSLEPGSIIWTPPGQKAADAAASLTGANIQLPMEWTTAQQAVIKEIMFANPLNLLNAGDKTATEANIINNNWIQKNAGFFSRLALELFPPLFNKTIQILTKKGILPRIMINDTPVDVQLDNIFFKLQYQSPLAKLQDQIMAQNLMQGAQSMLTLLGNPTGLLAINLEKFPKELLQRLQWPASMINDNFGDDYVKPIIAQIQKSLGAPQPVTEQPATFGNVSPNQQQMVS
jgi:hypothetical protein